MFTRTQAARYNHKWSLETNVEAHGNVTWPLSVSECDTEKVASAETADESSYIISDFSGNLWHISGVLFPPTELTASATELLAGPPGQRDVVWLMWKAKKSLQKCFKLPKRSVCTSILSAVFR